MNQNQKHGHCSACVSSDLMVRRRQWEGCERPQTHMKKIQQAHMGGGSWLHRERQVPVVLKLWERFMAELEKEWDQSEHSEKESGLGSEDYVKHTPEKWKVYEGGKTNEIKAKWYGFAPCCWRADWDRLDEKNVVKPTILKSELKHTLF